MVWLFTQTFVLCTFAFLAGAALTWLPLRAVIRGLRAQVGAVVDRPVRPVRAALPAARTVDVDEVDVGEVEAAEAEPAEVVVAEAVAAEVVTVEVEAEVAEAAEVAEEYPVKGSAKSMIFHTAESPYFKRMRGDVVFRSAVEAERAGYTRWTPRVAKVSGAAAARRTGGAGKTGASKTGAGKTGAGRNGRAKAVGAGKAGTTTG
ncbi:sunset domain-containing protein [Saccharothrix sp. Mg75]|uniref:sunset domain-containing protein n=1 Tax=Saccharothrix sp. Mg75 TaxID=3445357 RepID=UPI003EEFEF95